MESSRANEPIAQVKLLRERSGLSFVAVDVDAKSGLLKMEVKRGATVPVPAQ